MDRRRAAGLLLALAACIATATAAPTSSNHTALDLYDDAPEGCYYNFQHYGEGDRIMTNEPCLNCTCHNRMLMCYLRVCPFTKAIGQDCTIEKRADQCCPIVTCPDVPVDLLTSTTTSPAEYGSTGMGKLDKFGCSINGKYFPEGAKVPPTPNKPCEHCYCIRNMTTCVMQECTLHVDGCTPIYHKDVCCPVRYSCDHPEDEMPLLDDLSTTVRPTPGFLLTTTTISPVTQMSQDCVYDNRVFPDGALIKTEKACDHCYCMKGDIVCVVQECGTPMENEGKNCTALSPREGVCCPDTYICEGDEPTTGTYEAYDYSTQAAHEKLTTLSPPRRTSSEGSGYRNEPDESPYTEPEVEGSGEEEEQKQPSETMTAPTPGITSDILESTEETHEFIPLTTTKPEETSVISTTKASSEDKSDVSSDDVNKTTESQESLPITTGVYSKKEDDKPVTDKTYMQDTGSGELPEDDSLKPIEATSDLPLETTEINEITIVTTGVSDREPNEPQMPITTASIDEDKNTNDPMKQETTTTGTEEITTSKLAIEYEITSAPTVDKSTKTMELTEKTQIPEEGVSKSSISYTLATTTSIPIIENEVKVTDDINQENNLEAHHYPSSTIVPSIDDEFVTTETQEQELPTEIVKGTEKVQLQQHVTASTPMLEEIEKDTTEYNDPEHIIPIDVTQDNTFNIISTTMSNIPPIEDDKDATKVTIPEKYDNEDNVYRTTTNIPLYDQQGLTTVEPPVKKEIPVESNVKEIFEPEALSPSTSTPTTDESGRRTVQPDLAITIAEDSKLDINLSVTASSQNIDEFTTEPDKGLNTIPSDLIDEELPATPEIQITDIAEENITTETNSNTVFSPDSNSITSPSIHTTISTDTSVSREEPSTLTTEPAFRKEDYSPTDSQVSLDLSTVVAGVTTEVIPTLTHDDGTKSSVSALDTQEMLTTLKPQYTEDIERTTLYEESGEVQQYDSTSKVPVPEKDLGHEEETITSAPYDDKTPETTTANQKENEIFNEPRIPGEGDCLLNGIRYINESEIPSSNKCQSGCKCISSIIKCDPIICSPPPEYMNNCETTYDSPDSCCPTYICDHKMETIPPQSHSQMSGTEVPVILPIQCKGDECEIKEDKNHQEPSDACKSGNCADQSNETQETSSYSPAVVPEQPIIDQKDCVGDECTPVLCTEENGCQSTPDKHCEGEKCETSDVPLPCVNGKDCLIPSIPSQDCSSGECISINIPPEGTHLQEKPTKPVFNEECKGEGCKKLDNMPLDQSISEQCTEPGCKQPQLNIEDTTSTISEQTSQDTLNMDDKKEAPIKETESTEKLETFTEPSQGTHSHVTTDVIKSHETVTKQPEGTSDDSFTTVLDKNELVTKSEPELVATSDSTELHTVEENTTEHVPEKTIPEFTEEVQNQPTTTETTIKDYETKTSSPDAVSTEASNIFVTSKDTVNVGEHEMDTEHSQSTETSRPDGTIDDLPSKTITESSTELPIAYTTITQKAIESDEVTLEMSDKISTIQPPKESDNQYTTKETTDESITKPSEATDNENEDITKLSEITEHGETTVKYYVQDTSTLPSPTTEIQNITVSPDLISQDDITKKATEETITETSKITDDFTKGIPEESGIQTSTTLNIKEQSQETDYTPASERISTEIPVIVADSQKTTETPADITRDITTIKITEELDKELPTTVSTELDDITKLPEDNNILSIVTAESITELPKTSVTESQDFIKHTEHHDEATTDKIVVNSSTELNDYTTEQVSQNLDQEHTTKISTDNIGTTLPDIYHTDSHIATESPDDIINKDTTIITSQETSADMSQTSATVQYESNSKTSESSTEPSTTFSIEDQNSTKSPKTTAHAEITTTSEEHFTELPITTMKSQVYETTEEIEQQKTTYKTQGDQATEPSKQYSTEEQDDTKFSETVDYEGTTERIMQEYFTEPPKLQDVEEKDIASVSSFETMTDSPITRATDGLKTPEEIESKGTTIKATDESVTESYDQNEVQPDSERPEQQITDSDKTSATLKPDIVEIISEEPKKEYKPIMDSEKITTPTEVLFTHELTTSSSILESKITTPGMARPDETTVTTSRDLEPLPQTGDVSVATESSLKEQTIIPTKYETTTGIPVSSNFDQTYDEREPEQATLKPDSETQTAFLPTTGQEGDKDLLENLSTQHPDTVTVSVKEPTDTEIYVPIIEPIDELRTTSSEVQDLTTSIPTDIHYTLQKEQSTESLPTIVQEVPTKQETEQPALLEDEIKTEKAFTSADMDSTKGTESEPNKETTPSIKPTIPEENLVEEPVTKYSSPTIGSDSTEIYPGEELHTIEPMYKETIKPEKPADVQSLVTEQYKTSEKPFEKESEITTDSDRTQSNEQDILTTLPTKLSDTTINEMGDKVESVTPAVYPKPVDNEIHTEFPTFMDKTTTQNEHRPEEGALSEDSSKSEPNEFASSTAFDNKFTTERPDILFTTEDSATIAPVALFTEKHESDITEQVTSIEDKQTPIPDQYVTESEQDVTEAPKVERVTEVVPAVPSGSEIPIFEGEDHLSTSSITTDTPDDSNKQPEIATESNVVTETSSDFEALTSPKHEYSEITRITPEDVELSASTTLGEGFSAVPTKVTDTPLSPEIYSETQPETIETVTPMSVTLTEEYLTTKKQPELEVYQTIATVIEDIPEKTTGLPIISEEGTTTSIHDPGAHKNEQSTPVVITEVDKLSTSGDFIAVQTEKVPSASDKPALETTAPEEEFLIATSKPTTGDSKLEDEMEISTVSPAVDETSRPTDKPEEPITTILTEPITTAPEIPIVTEPEVFITSAPEELITKAPQESITTVPEAPVGIVSEASLTNVPEATTTLAPEEAITMSPEVPIVIVPDTAITNAPEEQITISPELSKVTVPQVPMTNAPIDIIYATPEAPLMTVPDAPLTNAPAELTTTAPETPNHTIPEAPVTNEAEEPITNSPVTLVTTSPEKTVSTLADELTPASSEASVTKVSEAHATTAPAEAVTSASEVPVTPTSQEPITTAYEVPVTPDTRAPEDIITISPETPYTEVPKAPITKAPEAPITEVPEAPTTKEDEGAISEEPEVTITKAPEAPITKTPEALITEVPEASITKAPESPITDVPEAPITKAPKTPITEVPEAPITKAPKTPITEVPEAPITKAPEAPITEVPEAPTTKAPEAPITEVHESPITKAPEAPITEVPEAPITKAPEAPITEVPEAPITKAPEAPITEVPEAPITKAPEVPITEVPEVPITKAPEVPITKEPEAHVTKAPEASVTIAPEIPKPVSTEPQPTDEESFPPSGGTSGYGQEPDYVEEDQTFGPGTCRYGGKVYVSAQQIPRDDPCDFCFCFRSDIICLQQSCPPPIHGCHEEPIQGFCCPRYECPVSMATTVNVTTTTTTTTTTLPPHFPTHSYKGSVHKQGCQIKGQTYKVGEVVRASSGPCLHCTCGGDGQMKCDPKVCTPEPMLRQMIAAAVSAKRRR